MADLNSVWAHPPRATRGAQPTLSREQIVRAALELLDAEGPAGLSMRRLGTKLGSGTTSVYWYVANKEELLELAVDEVLGEVYVPEPGDTDWRVGASILANGMRAALLRHPWVLGQLGGRPTLGPNAMRMGDRTVALLAAAGFTGLEISYAGSLLHSHAIGSATTESAVAGVVTRSGLRPGELAEQIKPLVERMADDYPHYDAWRRANGGVAGPDPDRMMDNTFAFGLERLLDGLALWLDRNPEARNPEAQKAATGKPEAQKAGTRKPEIRKAG
ncbi:TetR/AcrR family transcriptional regulator [Actinoplanes regularis]|uniref:Transcriptional regulator, TetR family n=1 Tax=Actinoplanes regularis TaxID=52697 RepID=A0A238V7P1_9ACTN|nr:TetR/AcrR family transcriptional regulator [Actinoplanes regularis]GIE83757.1 TetR family transcriptional regulator [Actinoplanes regularis]SNR30445.1 transcriptional regulator, TetR family [Actinoplanes regularis]